MGGWALNPGTLPLNLSAFSRQARYVSEHAASLSRETLFLQHRAAGAFVSTFLFPVPPAVDPFSSVGAANGVGHGDSFEK